MEITKTPNGKYLLHLDEPVGLGAPENPKMEILPILVVAGSPIR